MSLSKNICKHVLEKAISKKKVLLPKRGTGGRGSVETFFLYNAMVNLILRLINHEIKSRISKNWYIYSAYKLNTSR